MNYEAIRWQVDAGILTITLNRPDQLNAFTVQMMSELVHAFGRASEDDEVRAIVVTGAGRAFCAGMDLAAGGDNVFGVDSALRPTVADIFDANEALRGGLAKAVYSPDTLLDEAYKLAHKYADKRSPVSLALIRQMTWRNSAQQHPIEAHRIESLGVFYTSIGDGQEGVLAFREKRAPQFTGKASEMPPIYPWWR